jgi:hypothetical protein
VTECAVFPEPWGPFKYYPDNVFTLALSVITFKHIKSMLVAHAALCILASCPIGIYKISRKSSVRETSQQVPVNAIVYNMSKRLQNRMSE